MDAAGQKKSQVCGIYAAKRAQMESLRPPEEIMCVAAAREKTKNQAIGGPAKMAARQPSLPGIPGIILEHAVLDTGPDKIIKSVIPELIGALRCPGVAPQGLAQMDAVLLPGSSARRSI